MGNAKSEVRTKKRKRRQSFFRSVFFILCLLFLFGIVRLYVIESLHISTDSMETTLHKGDFVLVNKFPFGNKPERRDIVLFTSPLRKDSLAAPLLISRCIGIAGDTIRVNANGYRINGEEYPHSPNTLNTYFMPNEGKAIYAKKEEIVPNGLPDEAITKNKQSEKDMLNVLFIGLLEESKGERVLHRLRA